MPGVFSGPRRALLGRSLELKRALAAYWKLNEANGNRADSVGATTLTDNNTVLSAAGKLGTAADFELSTSEYLSASSNAAVGTGDVDFTLAAWIKAESIDGTTLNHTIFGKDATAVGADREYVLRITGGGSPVFTFIVYKSGPTAVILNATAFGAPATATWYFVVAWHDFNADMIYLQINNGVVYAQATGGALQAAGAGEFRLGARNSAGNPDYFDGLIDEAGIWKRILSPEERTALYNGGVGLSYPFGA